MNSTFIQNISQGQLLALLQGNVLDIIFMRRSEKKPGSTGFNLTNWPMTRRMICTNDFQLLNSVPGMIAMHFKRPTHPPAYNWRARNLVCTWDIFWNEFRMVNASACTVVAVGPTKPYEHFWATFFPWYASMGVSEKINIMSSKK